MSEEPGLPDAAAPSFADPDLAEVAARCLVGGDQALRPLMYLYMRRAFREADAADGDGDDG